ncbi:MAG: tetratricopeptide repeat protein [Terriglobia bacterium]
MPATLTRLFLFTCCCLQAARGADNRPGLQDASAAVQRGDFAGAERRLLTELKTHPNDAEALSLLGIALDNQKKLAEAETAHRQAIAAEPGSARILGRYAGHLALSGNEKAARETFQRALVVDPSDHYANLQLAQMAMKARHAAEALSYLDHLTAAQRDAPDVAVLRLAALDLGGDSKQAEAVFERLASTTQNDARLSASVGWSLTQYGEFNRAETFLTHALAADPSNFHVLYDLGVVALYGNHYDRAREVLETAVRQQPEDVDALYSLAFAFSALHQPEPALRMLARAARLAPRRADVQRLIAVTTGELQANEDSAAAWERYAELAPGDDTARRERGFARIHLRQFDTGIADLEWYVGRHPEDPMGHYELGLAESTSDPTKGLASLDKALELKPDFVAARSARGALNYVQGKPEAAVPDLESAAAAEPGNGMILDRLGQAYRALDRLTDSIRVLRQAASLAPTQATIQLHLASALAEAGETAESEALMDRYRQMRPTQAPKDLMRYLSLTPEQQRSDYRLRVEKAIHDNPGDLGAQLRYLKLSLEDGRMEQAATTARFISEAKPGGALLAEAGRALLEARQYPAARDLLEKAVAADASAGLELDLALAVFRTRGPAEGLRQIDRVPEKGHNADYYLARAQMLDGLGKNSDAIAAMQLALKAAPSRADLYWEASVLLHRDGRTGEAIKLLDRAAQLLPQDPQVPLIQATLLEMSGQTADAGKLLGEIQHRWPEGSAVWAARGLILAAHHRYEEARRVLETAAALGARSPEVFYNLADCTLRATPDRINDAEAAAGRALALAPDDASIQALAGQIAFRKGDYLAAVERQASAAKLRPGWAEPHRSLAQAYEALGRKADARAESILADSSGAAADPVDPRRLFETRPPQDW